jgi:hypothetical protein
VFGRIVPEGALMSNIRFASLIIAIALAASPLAASQHAGHGSDNPRTLVEHVRQATRQFADVRNAIAAGYAPFLGCVSGPQEGAMGVHFVNSTLVGDGELDADHPEALIYEPANGALMLVGVEFLVLADSWDARHAEPPVLEGQAFQYNGSPNRFGLPAFYELHVWASRDNPHGAFVDWNPRVSCEGR